MPFVVLFIADVVEKFNLLERPILLKDVEEFDDHFLKRHEKIDSSASHHRRMAVQDSVCWQDSLSAGKIDSFIIHSDSIQ